MEDPEFDVIIVGAGISGLAAAKHLVKNKKKVCILEAQNRVGGRIFSKTTPSGKVIDLGAQWIGEGQSNLISLLSEYSIKKFPDIAVGKHIQFLNNELRTYTNSIPDLGIIHLIDFYLALYRIEKDGESVSLDTPYKAKYAEEWDSMTVESWAKKHIHTKSVHEILDLYMESVFAASPRDMSFLFFLSTLHNSKGPVYGIEGASAYRVDGGLSQLCERIAEDLKGSIILNCPVKKVSQSKEKVILQTATSSYSARKAIITIPPVLASQISFFPPLPPKRDKLHQRMPMGSAIKTFAIYKKPFWKANGFSGKIINNEGLVRLIYDGSPSDNSYGALVAFVLGKRSIEAENASEASITGAVLNTLVKFLGEEAKEPDEFIIYNWNHDPWARGGYSGYMPPGVMNGLGDTVHEPTGNIYWAGDQMTSKFLGYVEGAIESGLKAANDILTHKSGSQHGK